MTAMHRGQSFGRLCAIVAVAAVAQAAHGGEILIEDFDDDVIDLQRWSISDHPGDGVTIRQENGRLEVSSAGGFSSGAAAIFSRDAFSTNTDIRVIVDYNLTVENPGASAVGLNVALFNGGDAESEDRIDIAIFRRGSLFFVDWFFIADGAQIDSGFTQTTANVDELTLFYRAATDTLTVSSVESASSDPVAVAIHRVVQRTGAQGLQLYLGGFVSGATSAVNGGDAFYDNLQVDGCLDDDGGGGDDGSAPLFLDARDDSDSFRRGTAADDRLGWSVRYAGDIDQDGVSDVIVGVPGDDAIANNAGSLSVLAGADGTLIFERHGVAAGDWLGFTAEGAGDWNGDGVDDVVVGAPGYDDGPSADAGAVFVYSGAPPHGVLWMQTGQAAGDQFGSSVARLGDVNNDGFDDIIVGAPLNDADGENAGRADVYLGQSGALGARKTGRVAGGEFGRVVAQIGDVDDDGDDDFAVAAPFNNQNGSNSGKVVVYSGRTGDRLFAFKGRSAGDRLGWSVAGVGDVDDDGHADIVIGAINEDTAGANAGAAYVVGGADGRVIRRIFGAAPGSRLGWAVTSIQDLDGDGIREVAVAAPKQATSASKSGRVFVCSGASGDLLIVIDGETTRNQFAMSLDGDDRSDNPVVGLVAGAWHFRSGGRNNRGAMYRFDFAR